MNLTETTTVRDLLQSHPEAFDVLVRHGMCEDCKADPPAVPLGHFARKHCGGDIQGLIHEIRTAVGAARAGGHGLAGLDREPAPNDY